MSPHPLDFSGLLAAIRQTDAALGDRAAYVDEQ